MAYGKSLELRAIEIPAPVFIHEHTSESNRFSRKHDRLRNRDGSWGKLINVPKGYWDPAVNEPYIKPKD